MTGFRRAERPQDRGQGVPPWSSYILATQQSMAILSQAPTATARGAQNAKTACWMAAVISGVPGQANFGRLIWGQNRFLVLLAGFFWTFLIFFFKF